MEIENFTNIKQHINKEVIIKGWVQRIHNLGGYIFIDIMRNGKKIQSLWAEKPSVFVGNVIEVHGLVIKRPADTQTDCENGDIEIEVKDFKILSQEKPLPFSINSQLNLNTQFKERILYLRSEKMQKMLKNRHKFLKWIRNYMDKSEFTEIHTPILTAPSPEGAKDFLVPTKNGSYALPQSPQLWKQTLMACGVNKYYQIAPCFRAEAGRADRHRGEFYQMDCEKAFATREWALDFFINMTVHMINEFNPKEILQKIMSFDEAMEKYGTDKPDLRRPAIENITQLVKKYNCSIFDRIIAQGGVVKSLMFPIAYKDILLKEADRLDLKIGYIFKDKKYGGSLKNILDESLVDDNSIRLFSAHKDSHTASKQLYDLYRILPVNNDKYSLVAIIDFPMYEKKDGKIEFTHNPFSTVYDDSVPILDQKANQYDLALNGYEILSGGIREHRVKKLLENFKKIGYSEDEARKNFFLFKSFEHGVPPHGGGAFGLERLMMILFDSVLFDVIPFPLNNSGKCLISSTPKPMNIKELIKNL